MLAYTYIACQKIVQQRLAASNQCITPTNSRPTTPQGNRLGINNYHHQNIPSPTNGYSTNNCNSVTANNSAMHPSGNFTLPHRYVDYNDVIVLHNFSQF